jgi:hypothetical protein
MQHEKSEATGQDPMTPWPVAFVSDNRAVFEFVIRPFAHTRAEHHPRPPQDHAGQQRMLAIDP